MKLAVATTLVLFLLLGCTAPLTQSGAMVRIIDNKDEYGYKFLGTVSGFDTLGSTTGVESENALNKARNRAAALGANAIKIVHMQTTMQGTSVAAEALLIDFENQTEE